MPVIIRRILIIVILIIATFFIYSLIDKPGATKLLAKIRGIDISHTNTWNNQNSGNVSDDIKDIINSGQIVELSGELSGLSEEETKSIDDDISKLFDTIANQTGNQWTGWKISTGNKPILTGSKNPPLTGSKKPLNSWSQTQSSSTSNELSAQDLKEVEKLLNNLVE